MEVTSLPNILRREFENLLCFVPDKLSNAIRLHTKSGIEAKHRYYENFVYGHREILLKYMGLDYSTQILGVIEHGMPEPFKYNDYRSPRYIAGRKTNFWAWSKDTEDFAKANGVNNVKAIGAPWLYLKKSLTDLNLNSGGEFRKFLIMPAHSAGSFVDIASAKEKSFRVKQFKEIVGNDSATVCLYGTDFCDPVIHNAYLDSGFKVTCLGYGMQTPLWSPAANRVRMLGTLFDLMQNHSHYLSDALGTSQFYAFNMGLNVGIFPEINSGQSIYNTEHTIDGYDELKKRDDIKYLRKVMPYAENNFASPETYSTLVERFLGADMLLSPADLRATLEYREGVYPQSPSAEPW